MKSKKWTAFALALAMVVSAVGFGLSAQPVSAATKAPKKITLKTTSKTVDIKGKVTVSVKAVSPKTASKSVTWKSSNKKIATVSSKGVVKGKKAGKVKITAVSKKNKKVKKSITITVKNMKPKVSLPSKATAYTSVKKTLKAKVGPTGVYNKGVTYKSSNTKVATVSSKGVVTPKKKGTVTITAYSKENKKIKDTCKVTVRQSITGLKFAAASKELKTGAAGTNKLTVSPSKPYSKTVVYTSSNTKVAAVDKSGKVTAVAAGTATIKATAKYGAKKTASYKVTVYDVLAADANGAYTIDKSKYSTYKIAAERSGKAVNLTLTNGDIDNLFGIGNIGFDWSLAEDVKEGFAKAAFNYASGNDYIFAKSGNKVTIKFAEDLARTSWYYVEGKSFAANGNDYTITLFEKTDGTGESIVLNKKGSALSVVKAGRSISLTKDGMEKVTVTAVMSAQSTATLTLERTKGTEYKISMTPNKVKEIKAYK